MQLKACSKKVCFKDLIQSENWTNAVVISEKLCKVYSWQVGLPGDVENSSHLMNVLIQQSSQYVRKRKNA